MGGRTKRNIVELVAKQERENYDHCPVLPFLNYYVLSIIIGTDSYFQNLYYVIEAFQYILSYTVEKLQKIECLPFQSDKNWWVAYKRGSERARWAFISSLITLSPPRTFTYYANAEHAGTFLRYVSTIPLLFTFYLSK